jgi:hypothetical protein
MADMLDIGEECGDHWTIWTYKDIGKMGLVYADPQSEWMQRTRSVREAKTTLRCDSWIERYEAETERLIQQISKHTRMTVANLPGAWANLDETLRGAICDGVLSRMLLPAFAEQFRGMSENEMDCMMQSFALQNCVRREGLTQLIKARLSNG